MSRANVLDKTKNFHLPKPKKKKKKTEYQRTLKEHDTKLSIKQTIRHDSNISSSLNNRSKAHRFLITVCHKHACKGKSSSLWSQLCISTLAAGNTIYWELSWMGCQLTLGLAPFIFKKTEETRSLEGAKAEIPG